MRYFPVFLDPTGYEPTCLEGARLVFDALADRAPRIAELSRVADTLVVLTPMPWLEELTQAIGEAIGQDRPAKPASSASLPEQQAVAAADGWPGRA